MQPIVNIISRIKNFNFYVYFARTESKYLFGNSVDPKENFIENRPAVRDSSTFRNLFKKNKRSLYIVLLDNASLRVQSCHVGLFQVKFYKLCVFEGFLLEKFRFAFIHNLGILGIFWSVLPYICCEII